MKKIIFIMIAAWLMVFGFGINSMAQIQDGEIEYFQSVYGMDKKLMVSEFLQINPTDPFWTIYDEYEVKRKDLGQTRFDLLNRYVENYDKLGDADYDEIVRQMIALRKNTDKLIEDYYKKVKKSNGSKVAAQFFQLEEYFISEIRAGIMEGIPYIGEFDK
ncbi:hypothetical protein [Cognataquiflexum rubidum]|uniref:hypothetical protein n=1 Tax=Cognataquiflexum rubidum TaxID=2922273 RepID=UPI001F1433E9|nr:hypothetical protein [Cognataquiflexum rubidum]MCH6236719.1 hypothetical protein [Cognataquiflexum rubidum]